ncbi:HWE histidine kinase domain-containing protein [Rhodovulum sp. PH10]|uniref:HWE histidine kinase domain-containing protein n=1 Tax=Rhodovulum sp. PH10 TaxID=1187851 RepID=UPI0002ED7918|nr:HWE histidine kinase domain-containing protein [Rhodovulum sp. PH10]
MSVLPSRARRQKSGPRPGLRLLRRPVPLRLALALLALGTLLPCLAFFALEYRVLIADKQADLARQGRVYAHAIADDVTREIAVKETQLAVLATSPHLHDGNIAGLYAQAKRTSEKIPGGVVLFAADGRQIFNTRAPFGAALPDSRNADVLRRVTASGACRTTDLFRSVLDEQPLVSLLCPVPGTPYVLSGNLPVEHLRRVVGRQTAADWASTLVDRNGLVVARSADAPEALGTRLPAAVRATLSEADDGWTTLEAGDGADGAAGGEPFDAAWQHLPNGWTVLTAVPHARVIAPMSRWTRDVFFSLVVFSLIAFASAALVGEWIIAAMRGLADAARAIGRGAVIERVRSSIREVAEVGQALAQASHDRAKGEIANAHLAALVSSSGDAIMSVSLDGEILSWNKAAEELYGYRADEAVCRSHAMLVPPARLSEIEEKATAAREGRSLRLETIRLHKNGTPVEVSLDAAPIRGADGTVVGISVIAHDIGQRKRDEAHVAFVMRELSHRTKNLITVIIAMARRSVRQSDDFADFEDRFTGRLHGLARSHDLLVHTDWTGGSIEELVRLQLAPFVSEQSSLSVEGPDLLLRPEAVQNLGFALHELATNAHKYGALGWPGGRVTIRWRRTRGPDGDVRVKLTWQEAGGPVVDPPARTGFGSTVIQKLTAASLNATVDLAFDPAGLRWEVDMPATEILSDGNPFPIVPIGAAAPPRSASPPTSLSTH